MNKDLIDYIMFHVDKGVYHNTLIQDCIKDGFNEQDIMEEIERLISTGVLVKDIENGWIVVEEWMPRTAEEIRERNSGEALALDSDMYKDGTFENMIWEIFCELGEFKLDLENDSFRVADSRKYDYNNSIYIPISFPLRTTIKEAVEAAYKQLGLDCENE